MLRLRAGETALIELGYVQLAPLQLIKLSGDLLPVRKSQAGREGTLGSHPLANR